MADAAVLINEFGEVGIDHHLVDKIDDNVVLLDSGCLCCSVRGDLTRSLRDLFMKRLRREIPAFSRVLIETTGLADPAPVIYTLMEDFFIAERYRSDGVVTAVDVTHADAQLARHPEASKQIAMADRLLLTKCDLATSEQVDEIVRRITPLNPGAPRIEVRNGAVDAAALAGNGLYDPATKTADVRRWLAEEAVRAAAANGIRMPTHTIRTVTMRGCTASCCASRSRSSGESSPRRSMCCCSPAAIASCASRAWSTWSAKMRRVSCIACSTSVIRGGAAGVADV